MIKECNNHELDEKGIDSKYYLFYQVWKELTGKKTMDSYQYHIMNSLEALRELDMVIGQRLNRYHSTNHNIDECKAETIEIIGRDRVIRKYYPCIWSQLMTHLASTAETDAKQRALKYQIEYSYGILRDNYLQFLINELEEDLENSNKTNIINKTDMLISNCVSNGWSTLALANMVDILNDSKVDGTKWNTFKNRLLMSDEENYCVFIPVRINLKSTRSQTRQVALEKMYKEILEMGITTKTKDEICSEYNCFEGNAIKDVRHMEVNVLAYDYYSAVYKAIDICTNVLNILGFYNYIEPWNVKNIRCWSLNKESGSVKEIYVNDLYATYDYIESSIKIYKTSKNIYLLGDTSVSRKLQDAYAYTNMGKGAVAQEERFINTWIALESLCRGDVYENIISNVLETVPPALCLRYVYQHFRNFIEDAGRCSIDFSFSTRTIDLSGQRSKEEIVKDILDVFKDDTLYAELLAKCAVNDLLIQRCDYLHKLATDKNELFNKIGQHYTNVKRQLSRLYRIRNDIAHNAMTSNGTLILYIEHLEDYLTKFVGEVVMCADKKHEYNIELIFEMIKDNYQIFYDIVHNKKNAAPNVVLNGLLDNGIIDLI